jgi:hypothetical protein
VKTSRTMASYLHVHQESHTWKLSLQLPPCSQLTALTELCSQLVHALRQTTDFVYLTKVTQRVYQMDGMSDKNERQQADVLYEMLLYPLVFRAKWDARGKVSEVAHRVLTIICQNHTGGGGILPEVDASKLLHLLNEICVPSMICEGFFYLLQDFLAAWFWGCCIHNIPSITYANNSIKLNARYNQLDHINIPLVDLSLPIDTSTKPTSTLVTKNVRGCSNMDISESYTILPTSIIQWLSSQVTGVVMADEPTGYSGSPPTGENENIRITYTAHLEYEDPFATLPSHRPVMRLHFFNRVYSASSGVFCIPNDLYVKLNTTNLVRSLSTVGELDNSTWGETIRKCTSTTQDEQTPVASLSHSAPTDDIVRGIDFSFFLRTWLKNISDVSLMSRMFDMSTCDTKLTDLNPPLRDRTLLSAVSSTSVSSCALNQTDNVHSIDVGSCVINMPAIHTRCIQTACLEHYIQNIVHTSSHLPYSSAGCLILVARPNKTQSWMSLLCDKFDIRQLTVSCPRTGTAAAEFLRTQTMSSSDTYNIGRTPGGNTSPLGTVTIMDTSLLSAVPIYIWQRIHWRMVVFDGHHAYDRKDESWAHVQTVQCSTRILLSNAHSDWSTRELICGGVPLPLKQMIYADNSILDRITLSPKQLRQRGLLHIHDDPHVRRGSSAYTADGKKHKKICVQPHLATEDDACCICYDVKRESVILSCMHSYCLGCITQWATNNQNCPICRRKIERYIQ